MDGGGMRIHEGPTTKRAARLVTITACLAIALMLSGAACSAKSSQSEPGLQNPTPTKEPGSVAGVNSVVIKNLSFQPQSILVLPNTEFLWTNEDSVAHTVTSGTPGSPTGQFDFSLPSKSSNAKFSFPQIGVVPYFCKIHTQMTGTINVST